MGTTVAVGLVVAVLVAVPFAVALRRARQRHAKAVGERGWLLERERESATRAAVDAERTRIAGELHDIVSHNVSVMIVQTSAAREVLRTMPDEALAALEAVETAGRDTMAELRHLLDLLNPEAGDLAPQPGLDALGPLVDRIAFAGMPVEVRISGEPRPLPSGIGATAYRIVQEALTNALKHGSGGKAEVTVRYAERTLRVEVLTTGPSVLTGDAPAVKNTGAGRGLLGLRERVAVYGGDLDARRRLGGGYRVRARIPHE
ncbi:signal transduction histidine kinase [Actinoplanes lutulentus]|uniref:histidine kinase n=1 Tax=Actinoplanes lutulentus TaxID=1287878 RepID=A0A327Z8C1_9ACTN|nr:histidine kinase [Actinoplanes lutulentus]MBB2949235.1 signal transduction histidine kinase [Actinoplanes lutulentus]RAK34615.1 histidine kinase/DNA gyrase B/HSP90-like ATPase [Actinoplanes lutulentus]